MEGLQQNEITNIYNNTIKLEKELLNVLRKKSPSDKSVTQLRLTIRENYEKIILSDIEFASTKDVDQQLWKCVYYRPIEEYRKIIKKYHSVAFGDASSTTALPATSTDQVNAGAKEKLHKACGAFRKFLEEGGVYYEGLFAKIKQRYDQYRKQEHNTRLAKMCLTSLHKCLIIQGDLARYTQLYNEQQNKDWTSAQRHYIHALELLPNNGNPHNQLAVLATYQDDSCEAIYRYFRSLAVKKPFVSARENLILLFEKNRQKYLAQQQKHEAETRSGGRGSSRRGRGGRSGSQSSSQQPHLSMPEIKQRFITAFVRLHGILFTKTSMETFDNIQQEVMDLLNQLNFPADREVKDEEPEDYLSENLVLKLVLMNVYSIQNTSTYLNQLQQHNPYLDSACSLAFSTFQILCQHAMNTAPIYAYLGSLITFLQYVDQHREHTVYQYRELAKSTLWAGLASLLQTIGSNQGTYNNLSDDDIDVASARKERRLPEDVELSGFLPIKTETSSSRGSGSIVIQGQAAIEVRTNRLNDLVNRLINDDRIDLYFDYEKGIYTTEQNENSKPVFNSSLRSQIQQPKHVEEIEDEDEELVQVSQASDKIVKETVAAPQKEEENFNNQFMSMDSHAVMDDNQLIEDQYEEGEDFAFEHEMNVPFTGNVIERPFGTSSAQQQKNEWGNNNVGTSGNLMSKLLQNPQQQQLHYNSFFSTLFNGSDSADGSLFGNDDTWAPIDNNKMFASSNLFGMNQNIPIGGVIERPFQQQRVSQQPQQQLFNGGVIDSPFSNWRTASQPNQTQQQPMDFSPFGNFQIPSQNRLFQQQKPQQQGANNPYTS